MPPADKSGSGRPREGPQNERARALVWRSGDALLAVPLAAVLEIAAPDADGRVRSRVGSLPVSTVPGLPPAANPPRAVVIRAGGATVALAADDVEGVREYTARESARTPPWLRLLNIDHLAGLVRLDEGRVAALLAVETLHPS